MVITAIEKGGNDICVTVHCDCGKDVKISKRALEGSRKRCSPGCPEGVNANRKYIPKVGDKHGNWTVIISKLIRKDKSRSKVLCRCKCGTKSEVLITSLYNGRSKQCSACGSKEGGKAVGGRNKVSHVGKKYGNLTVVKEGLDDGRRIIGCSCDCGAYKVLLLDNVVSGRTSTCGCSMAAA